MVFLEPLVRPPFSRSQLERLVSKGENIFLPHWDANASAWFSLVDLGIQRFARVEEDLGVRSCWGSPWQGVGESAFLGVMILRVHLVRKPAQGSMSLEATRCIAAWGGGNSVISGGKCERPRFVSAAGGFPGCPLLVADCKGKPSPKRQKGHFKGFIHKIPSEGTPFQPARH